MEKKEEEQSSKDIVDGGKEIEPKPEPEGVNLKHGEMKQKKKKGDKMKKEQLLKMLKEKTKELKKAKKKVGKVEEQYIKKYKENVSLKEEIKGLVDVLNEIIIKLEGKSIEYTADCASQFKAEFCSLWDGFLIREREMKELLENGLETQKQEFTIIKEQLLLQLEASNETNRTELADELDSKFKEKETALEKEKEKWTKKLDNSNNLVEKLQQETNDLLNTICEKDKELFKFKKIQKDLLNNQADELLEQFEEIELLDIDSKRLESERTNDLISLRNKLEKAEDMLLDFQQSKDGLSENKEIEHKSTQIKSLSTAVKATKALRKQQSFEKALEEDQKRKNNHGEQSIESRQYFKDLIIKFMIYSARNEEKQVKVTRKAILDYLHVPHQSRKLINDAIINQNSFGDSVFFYNIFKSK